MSATLFLIVKTLLSFFISGLGFVSEFLKAYLDARKDKSKGGVKIPILLIIGGFVFCAVFFIIFKHNDINDLYCSIISCEPIVTEPVVPSHPVQEPIINASPCTQEAVLNRAASHGVDGFLKFIDQCKIEGGDLLRKAYDGLDNVMYKTGMSCLKALPLCHMEANEQCLSGYSDLKSPYLKPNSGRYAHIKAIDAELNGHDGSGAQCMMYGALLLPGKPGQLTPVPVVTRQDKSDEVSHRMANYTIRLELFEAQKTCRAGKCTTSEPISKRILIYVSPDGRGITFVSDAGIDSADEGDKATIGVPYALPNSGNWKYERVFLWDTDNEVLQMKTTASEMRGKNTVSEIMQMLFITRSGDGCFARRAAVSQPSDDKERNIYIPVVQGQNCSLIEGFSRDWTTKTAN